MEPVIAQWIDYLNEGKHIAFHPKDDVTLYSVQVWGMTNP
jgi:hypothetical protein